MSTLPLPSKTIVFPNKPVPYLVYMTQIDWLRENASREESGTNRVTIINQKHRKVSRYIGYSICKYTR